MVEQLREAIKNDGRSLNQLAQLTGVDSGRLSRFMTGKRGLTQEALDRIFRALRLRVVGEITSPELAAGPPPGAEGKAKKKGRKGGGER